MMFKSILALVIVLIRHYVEAEEPYACDATFKFDASTKGEIKSPGYDLGQYPGDRHCQYRITAPEGYRIKLTFLDMDIDPTSSCDFDRILILSKNEGRTILTVCGHYNLYPVLSDEGENEMMLVFEADSIGFGRGFRVQYESAPDMSLCGRDEKECRNRNCYKVVNRCDGKDDCGDGTDEEACGKPVALPSNEQCGNAPIDPITQAFAVDRQVGGIEAVPNSWPWQVSIQYVDIEPNAQFCGGTLISPLWVVTAAHCVTGGSDPANVKLVLGSHNKYKKTRYETTRFGARVISYPDLEGDKLRYLNRKHDIALIKLNAPVAFNDGIQPACLPYLGWEARPGWTCFSSGWGATKGSGFSDVLKQTTQIIAEQSKCKQTDLKTQICVQQKFNSPCHGDSGGPLVCKLGGKWYLMGAVSHGTGSNYLGGLCGMEEFDIIYAKVSEKYDWIHKIIEADSSA